MDKRNEKYTTEKNNIYSIYVSSSKADINSRKRIQLYGFISRFHNFVEKLVLRLRILLLNGIC